MLKYRTEIRHEQKVYAMISERYNGKIKRFILVITGHQLVSDTIIKRVHIRTYFVNNKRVGQGGGSPHHDID